MPWQLTSLPPPGRSGGPPPGVVIIFTPSGISNTSAQNQGTIAGTFTVQSGNQPSPLVLSGVGAQYFTTDNGGICPCHLVYAVDVPDSIASGFASGYPLSWTPG